MYSNSMVKLNYLNKEVYVPQSWSDLDRKTFVKIFEIINTRIDYNEQRILILQHLMKMRNKHFKKINRDQLLDLLKLTDFIYSKDEKVILSINPLPYFRIRGRPFIGPLMDLSNFTIEDYGAIDVCIYHYSSTKDLHWLYRMAAILYKPISWSVRIKNLFRPIPKDNRVPYYDKGVDDRTSFFKKHLSHDMLDAIHFIYLAIQNFLKYQFPAVYEKAEEDMEEEEVKNDYGWSAVIMDMAGPKFGTINQTTMHLATDILLVLNRDIEKEKERKFQSRFKY